MMAANSTAAGASKLGNHAVNVLDPSPSDILEGFVPLSHIAWQTQTPKVRAQFEAACRSDHYVKVLQFLEFPMLSDILVI